MTVDAETDEECSSPRHTAGCTGRPPTWGCDACRSALHAPVPSGLSAGARRTLNNELQFIRGIHPATGVPLRDGSATCATCAHLVERRRGKVYFKCVKHRLGLSCSDASDVRKRWPACALYEQPDDTPTRTAP